MLALSKKALSALLSMVLVVSLCPVAAYAQPAEERTGDKNTVQSEASEAEEAFEAIEEQAEDTVGFVYVESATLEIGATQNVAVGLADENAVITAAALTVENENGEFATIDATNVAENAALFSWEPSETGLVTVQSMEYALEGADEPALVTFENINGEGAYSIDVVSAQLMEALDAEAAEEGITAMVLDEDGGITAADSVEEAIKLADEDGVEAIIEPESDASELISADETIFINDEAVAGEDSSDAAAPGLEDFFGVREAYGDEVTNTRENYLVVAIDPGHGGSDNGAVGNGLMEKNLTLAISQAMQIELKKYTGVTPYMTRTTDKYVGLETRVNLAAARGADVFISIHINSADSTSAKGAEVWYPNGSSYNKSTYSTGEALSQKILNQLLKLGLNNRGIKMRTSDSNKYPDGSPRDYYSVIRNSRAKNIPGIIVEHAFISNKDDAKKLADSATLTKMGQGDAQGVVQQYSLGLNSTAKSKSLVAATSRVKTLGWETTVYDKKVSGTTGKGLALNAFKVQLTNAAAKAGGIEYSANGGAWKSNNAVAGEEKDSSTIRTIQMRLTGSASSTYDVYYRVYLNGQGWLGWAKNGARAGTASSSHYIQGFEVVLVKKNGKAPGTTAGAYYAALVQYKTHVQTYGWQGWQYDGATSGTTGKSKRLEGIYIKLASQPYAGSIQYKTHVQTYGWQGWKNNGALSGTTGKSKRLEAIQIKLTGEMAKQYDAYYRVHAQTFGWMGWAKNGASAGTAGYSKRLEAIQIKLVKKGSAAPGSTANAFRQKK